MRIFPYEVNIWIGELIKIVCPLHCGLASYNLLRTWIEQKDEGRKNLVLPAWLLELGITFPTLGAPSSQAFGVGLNYTTSFPESSVLSKSSSQFLIINFFIYMCICVSPQDGDPFQSPREGSCLTIRNELSEDTCADRARDFVGKGCLGREQQGKRTQGNCSATRLAVLGFVVTVSGCLWPIILLVPIFGLTQGPAWWHVHHSANVDSSKKGSWRVIGRYYGLASPPFYCSC